MIAVFDMRIINRYPSLKAKAYVILRSLIFPFSSIERYYPKKGIIYDVGCGFGSYSLSLALSSKKRNVFGLELSKQRVSEARKAAKGVRNLHFEVRDLRKSKKLAVCDCISLIDILHHISYKTQEELIAECFKKLKRKGTLIIKDIGDKPRWKYFYNYFHDRIIMRNKELFFRSPQEICDMCRIAGFKVTVKEAKTWPLNPFPHVIFICEKN